MPVYDAIITPLSSALWTPFGAFGPGGHASNSTRQDGDLESGARGNEDPIPPRDLTTRPQQSQASEHSDRIKEDILNNISECPICNDQISFGAPVWSCSRCFQVYHFPCVKRWAGTDTQQNLWSCPTCKFMHQPLGPKGTCWCTACEYDIPRILYNSCGRTCNSYRRCVNPAKCTTFCSKPCHPGPCDGPKCSTACTSLSGNQSHGAGVAEPPPPYRLNLLARPAREVVGNLQRENARSAPEQNSTGTSQTPHATQNTTAQNTTAQNTATPPERTQRDPEPHNPLYGTTIQSAGGYIALFVILEIALAIWCWLEVRWQTQPMKNQSHVELHSRKDWALMLIASFLGSPMFGIWLVSALHEMGYHLAEKCRNSDMASFKRSLLSFARTFVLVLATIISVPSLFWFPVAWHVAPQYAFKNQMKHTCEGFDTRFNLGNVATGMSNPYSHYSGKSWSGIDLSSILPRPNEFSISYHIHSEERPEEDIYNFYRVTVPMTENHDLAIEVGVAAKKWRIRDVQYGASIPTTDKAKKHPYQVRMNDHQEETLLRNGTWGFEDRDVTIHNLTSEIVMPNMHLFLARPRYQPFIKVFRTAGMSEVEIEQQSRKAWTAASEDNIVMRTSSFGMGMHDLEVCGRRGDFYSSDGRVRPGIGDDTLLPLAFFVLFRHYNSFGIALGKNAPYGSMGLSSNW